MSAQASFIKRSQPKEQIDMLDPPHPSLAPPATEQAPSALLSPGAELHLQRLRGALDEANMALGDYHLANAQKDSALAISAAAKLEIALRGDLHAIASNLLTATMNVVAERRRKQHRSTKGVAS
jgi:hypothetical protein